jgi:hypothetical protein
MLGSLITAPLRLSLRATGFVIDEAIGLTQRAIGLLGHDDVRANGATHAPDGAGRSGAAPSAAAPQAAGSSPAPISDIVPAAPISDIVPPAPMADSAPPEPPPPAHVSD